LYFLCGEKFIKINKKSSTVFEKKTEEDGKNFFIK